MFGGNALVLGYDDITFFVGNIEFGHFAAQALGHQLHQGAFGLQGKVIKTEKVRQNLLGVESQCLE